MNHDQSIKTLNQVQIYGFWRWGDLRPIPMDLYLEPRLDAKAQQLQLDLQIKKTEMAKHED